MSIPSTILVSLDFFSTVLMSMGLDFLELGLELAMLGEVGADLVYGVRGGLVCGDAVVEAKRSPDRSMEEEFNLLCLRSTGVLCSLLSVTDQ